jgi:hypothetical protein
VYPNPVRPQYDGTVKIAGLINRANVKITDIAGNLVYEVFRGWHNGMGYYCFGKYKVASGVYMILYRRRTEWKPKLKKVMIVR